MLYGAIVTSAFVQMPIHPASNSGLTVYTVLMAIVTVGMLCWWALSDERRRGPALPLLLAGGALSVICEPVYDNLVLFWYPPHQQLSAFHVFGRTVPICVVIGYAWFCGGLPYLAARLFGRGISARGLWMLAGAVLILDFVAIGLTSWIDIAGFYGGQPFDVAGYPLWWGAVDIFNVIVAGAVVQYLLPRLTGARRLYLVLVPTLVVGAAMGAVAGPVAIALNSNWSGLGKALGALATVGLGAAAVRLVAGAVVRKPAAAAAAGEGLAPPGENRYSLIENGGSQASRQSA
jgi:hypothetical protein